MGVELREEQDVTRLHLGIDGRVVGPREYFVSIRGIPSMGITGLEDGIDLFLPPRPLEIEICLTLPYKVAK